MFRLYLDEVGTDDLQHIEQDNHRFLSLTGVIIQCDHVRDFLNPAIRELKAQVFDFDPDEIIHLHRTDIVKRKSVFGQLNENNRRALFDQLLEELIRDVRYSVITVFVDKLNMTRQRHWEKKHPYHYLMEIMVEKYTQFLERHNSIGDIMPEARRGKKDIALQAEFSRVKANGSRYICVDRIASVIRADKLKFRTKKDNISGLQLCDLVAHPSHFHIREGLGHDVNVGDYANRVRAILIEEKYDRSPRGEISGYGIKICP